MKHFNSKTYFSWLKLLFSGTVMACYVALIIPPLTGVPTFHMNGVAWMQTLVNVVVVVMFIATIAIAGSVFGNQLYAYALVRYPYKVMRRLFNRRGVSSAPKIFSWSGDRYTFSKVSAGYSIEIITKDYREIFTVSRREVHMPSRHEPLTRKDRMALIRATRFISGFYQLSMLSSKTSRQADTVTVSDGVSTVRDMFADTSSNEH